MTRVHCAAPPNGMIISVGPEVLRRRIVQCVAVLRPLDVPSTNYKYGKVLSHSAVLCRTTKEFVMVEYMNISKVLVNLVGSFKDKDGDLGETFFYHGFTFHYISPPLQPKKRVTINEFATKMVEFMKDRTFDTFTHNCHHARYLTMKHFGMKTEDPYNIKRNVLFQGVADYFTNYNKKSVSS